ncbi:MAG: hypothetical protein R3C20_02050 [Planctomycetaceae bacterium]
MSVTLSALAGCGGGGGGSYNGPWAQVSGVVNLGGKPLAEAATVTFLSPEGYAASGKVDASGSYKLKYNGANNIPVGTYSVGVLPSLPVEPTNQDPASFFNPDGTTKEVEVVISKIPENMRQPGSSGIQITVVEGPQELPIDLD